MKKGSIYESEKPSTSSTIQTRFGNLYFNDPSYQPGTDSSTAEVSISKYRDIENKQFQSIPFLDETPIYKKNDTPIQKSMFDRFQETQGQSLSPGLRRNLEEVSLVATKYSQKEKTAVDEDSFDDNFGENTDLKGD